MQLGIAIFGLGFVTVLVGMVFMTLGMRGGGGTCGAGVLLALAGAAVVVAAGAAGGKVAFLVTLVCVVLGLALAVGLVLVAGVMIERAARWALFPLRRGSFAAALENPAAVTLAPASRLSGIFAIRHWDDRGFVVTEIAESYNRDGCCAESGYVRTDGRAPEAGEIIPGCGRIQTADRLGGGWWSVRVHPHPDWPMIRKPSSPNWSA